MNPNTRISIHCYAGDGRQVREMLPHLLTHECPITVLSPADSRVEITEPNVDSRFGGQQQSIGPLSIQRQREHLRILLSYPEDFFLLHDADSVCLSPEFPNYLYEEPHTLWSNIVWIEDQGERNACDRRQLPHVAFQPPYFASRGTLEALLAASTPYRDQFDGFIDHFMVQAAVEAGVMWKGFHGGISTAISLDNNELQRAHVAVRHKGAIFIHGVKTPRFWQPLVAAHRAWLDDYRPAGDYRPPAQRITTDEGRRPGTHEYVRPVMANSRITYFRNGEGPRVSAMRPRSLQQKLAVHRRHGVKA